jgi:hypothetical protein
LNFGSGRADVFYEISLFLFKKLGFTARTSIGQRNFCVRGYLLSWTFAEQRDFLCTHVDVNPGIITAEV